jgi:hypothetical protein
MTLLILFVYLCFGHLATFSIARICMVERMDDTWIIIWKGFVRKRSWLIELLSWNLPGVTESQENPSQNIKCPGRNSNGSQPEYDSGGLPLRRPVRFCLFDVEIFMNICSVSDVKLARFQNAMRLIVLSEKCYINVGPILNRYVGIAGKWRNEKKIDASVNRFYLFILSAA